jgi:hypothetical protein
MYRTHNTPTAILAALIAGLLTGCGAEPDSSAVADEAVVRPAESVLPPATKVDPCTLLSLEEVQAVLPKTRGPLTQDPPNHQCVFFDGLFVQVGPMTHDDVKLDRELWKLEPVEIDVPGTDWAIARIDAEAATPREIHDLIAVGPAGTLSLVPTGGNDGISFGSADYEAMLDLLKAGYSRLGEQQ